MGKMPFFFTGKIEEAGGWAAWPAVAALAGGLGRGGGGQGEGKMERGSRGTYSLSHLGLGWHREVAPRWRADGGRSGTSGGAAKQGGGRGWLGKCTMGRRATQAPFIGG